MLPSLPIYECVAQLLWCPIGHQRQVREIPDGINGGFFLPTRQRCSCFQWWNLNLLFAQSHYKLNNSRCAYVKSRCHANVHLIRLIWINHRLKARFSSRNLKTFFWGLSSMNFANRESVDRYEEVLCKCLIISNYRKLCATISCFCHKSR